MTQAKEAWLKMADWCARQERSSFDARQKMKTFGIDEREQEHILAKLISEKYVDDSRFAQFYVKDKFKFNGWGRIKIHWQLAQKRIATTIITDALAELNDQDYENKLRDLLTTKMKNIKFKDAWQTKAALLRFSQSRGFEYELSSLIIQQITNQANK